MFATFNRFEIAMKLADARHASHQGQCDRDVADLVRIPRIRKQLDEIGPDRIREELGEYGAWDGEELEDDIQNRHRIVWLAACDIAEEQQEAPL
jgi:hypothetical protein